MGPSNQVHSARLPGRILWSVSPAVDMGNFSPVDDGDVIQEMFEHKLVSFGAVVALWVLVTLQIRLTRRLLKWKYTETRQKLCHFGRHFAKAKLLCLKSFVPVSRAGMFICEQ